LAAIGRGHLRTGLKRCRRISSRQVFRPSAAPACRAGLAGHGRAGGAGPPKREMVAPGGSGPVVRGAHAPGELRTSRTGRPTRDCDRTRRRCRQRSVC
jgi:hypothetical protein